MTENDSNAESPRTGRRAWPAVGRVRVLLLAEVFGYLALLAAFIWFALPTGGELRLVHLLFAPTAVALPLLFNRWHGDRLRDGGCRADNFSNALRGILLPVGIVVLGILIVGALADGFPASTPARFLRNATRYVAWGPIQQYFLCGFILRRLLQAGLSERAAILTAAITFGAIHGPNPVLAALATGFALFSCVLFLRHPNILALGLAHGVLALSVYHALPVHWHEKLTVGGVYRARMEEIPKVLRGVSQEELRSMLKYRCFVFEE